MSVNLDKTILEIHRAGKTNPEIARVLDVKVENVRAALKRNGLTRNPAKGGRREMSRSERVEKIASLLKAGLNKEEIAKEMRLSPSSMGNWMSEARAMAFPEGQHAELKASGANLENIPRKDGALPAGHPIAMDAIWRGLEHWRDGAQP